MKQVRCVSPHGGCRNGMTPNGNPVHALRDGTIPRPANLLLEPNEGGYVDDARIRGGFAAVGQVYEVADDFYADGFHWVEEATGNATEPPAASPAASAPEPPAPPPPPPAKTPGEK